MNTTRRLLLLALVLALSISALVPVTAAAAENASAWVELLEFATVNDSGSNLFKLTSTGTITVETPQYMRCTKIDLLVAHPVNYAPTSIKVRYNGVLYPLTLQHIDDTTVRAYGENIPDTLYADIHIQFNKSGSGQVTYQLLSCRVSAINEQNFKADAEVLVQGVTHSTSTHITVPGAGDGLIIPDQILITCYDWMKYDSLTIWGSSTDFPITSIRATLGTLGLPLTVSYMEQGSFGGWFTSDTLEADTGDFSWTTGTESLLPDGKWLYCITIDLAEVDRTDNQVLTVYLTGWYDQAMGYGFNCQFVNGAITVADTSSVSWWTRFTTFMTELLGGDTGEAEDFKTEMEQQGQAVQDAADQIDAVTRPPLEDVDVDLGAYVDAAGTAQAGEMFGQLFDNELVMPMVMISLTVALAAFVIFGKR